MGSKTFVCLFSKFFLSRTHCGVVVFLHAAHRGSLRSPLSREGACVKSAGAPLHQKPIPLACQNMPQADLRNRSSAAAVKTYLCNSTFRRYFRRPTRHTKRSIGLTVVHLRAYNSLDKSSARSVNETLLHSGVNGNTTVVSKCRAF
jgi:hypothetical protein